MTWPARRGSGILLHPTSLPGPDGIGSAGAQARSFVEWAASAGFSVWQILPLGPTGYGNAPYGCLSSFAGNPNLVDAGDLVEDGLVAPEVLRSRPSFPEGRVDVDAAKAWKRMVLRNAWERFRSSPDSGLAAELDAYRDDPERRVWLDDWTLFLALKSRFGGARWSDWPEPLRDRHADALEEARSELSDEVGFHRFAQLLFHRQWMRLRSHARRLGVQILGDVPIYTVVDSADVWADREYFRLDAEGRPEAVAGVPPDYFSETGQLWGNPLYRWDRLAKDGYGWWIDRIAANLRLADAIRLDHFRGFASYWEVPAGEKTAMNGRWVEGPGRALFDAIRARLGELPFVAEDLGLITEDVHRLRDELGLPGMKVIQFGFYPPDSTHRFDRIPERDLYYTGTHDNDTARGWFETLEPALRRHVLDSLGTDPEGVVWALIEATFRSGGRLAVVPVQDALELGTEARMNHPGVEDGNWVWRLQGGELTAALADRLRELARETGRLPQ